MKLFYKDCKIFRRRSEKFRDRFCYKVQMYIFPVSEIGTSCNLCHFFSCFSYYFLHLDILIETNKVPSEYAGIREQALT